MAWILALSLVCRKEWKAVTVEVAGRVGAETVEIPSVAGVITQRNLPGKSPEKQKA